LIEYNVEMSATELLPADTPEVQRDRLDLSYLRHWAAELKVSDALEVLLSKSAGG
jgi:hypothetical protein